MVENHCYFPLLAILFLLREGILSITQLCFIFMFLDLKKKHGEEINLERNETYQFFESIHLVFWLLNQSGSVGGSRFFEDMKCCRCYNSMYKSQFITVRARDNDRLLSTSFIAMS